MTRWVAAVVTVGVIDGSPWGAAAVALIGGLSWWRTKCAQRRAEGSAAMRAANDHITQRIKESA